MIMLMCCRNLARTVPTNYCLLFGFTFAKAWTVGFLCSLFPADILIMAAFMTAAVVISLTIYAMTTKEDFTMCGASLFLMGCGLLCFGLFAIIIGSDFMYTAYCSIGVIVFGFYLVFDTQLIMGGKSHQLSEDDYIIGALILYLDIIIIFMKILQLLARAKR